MSDRRLYVRDFPPTATRCRYLWRYYMPLASTNEADRHRLSHRPPPGPPPRPLAARVRVLLLAPVPPRLPACSYVLNVPILHLRDFYSAPPDASLLPTNTRTAAASKSGYRSLQEIQLSSCGEVPVPVQRHRGEPGHTRDRHSRTSQTNLKTNPNHRLTRQTTPEPRDARVAPHHTTHPQARWW